MRAIPLAAKLATVGALALTGVTVGTASASASTWPSYLCSTLNVSGTSVSGTGCSLLSGSATLGLRANVSNIARGYFCASLDSVTGTSGDYAVEASSCKRA